MFHYLDQVKLYNNINLEIEYLNNRNVTNVHFMLILIKYNKMMYNIVLIHSRHNIYTEKSDYAKVSAIPHDTRRITTDMPVILYAITTRCLSFGICLNSLLSLINTA